MDVRYECDIWRGYNLAGLVRTIAEHENATVVSDDIGITVRIIRDGEEVVVTGYDSIILDVERKKL